MLHTKEDVQKDLEYLTNNPDSIRRHWEGARPLFAFVGPWSHEYSGCLTLIRDNPNMCKAVIKGVIDEKLTEEIASDDRIPTSVADITVEHLPVFAEWQNRIIDLQNAK